MTSHTLAGTQTVYGLPNTIYCLCHYLASGDLQITTSELMRMLWSVDSLVRATTGHQCGSADASSRMTHAIQCREHFEYVAM